MTHIPSSIFFYGYTDHFPYVSYFQQQIKATFPIIQYHHVESLLHSLVQLKFATNIASIGTIHVEQ